MRQPKTRPCRNGDYEVGYGKPPQNTRFQKGRSGNPGGRPRGMTAGRAMALALKEAYRPVTVREGDKVIRLPAIQAVLRGQIALAAKGNGPAQRAFIAAIQVVERELAATTAATESATTDVRKPSNRDMAKALLAALQTAEEE